MVYIPYNIALNIPQYVILYLKLWRKYEKLIVFINRYIYLINDTIFEDNPMARLTRFKIAKPDIEKFFDSLPNKIFYGKDLSRILAENRTPWRLTQSLSSQQFIAELINQSKLKAISLHSPEYDITLLRYAWGANPSIYQIALTIKPNSFLCHYTAMFLHNLTQQIPKKIYINTEQSKKKTILSKTLEQSRIDLAFKGRDRTTRLFYNYENWEIYCISGKNTSNFGVEELQISESEKIPVTNIERTLIDISVRPIYAGGVHQVLNAFKEAKGKFSINKLLAMLKQLDYTYPYHQVIGFYMERAGYNDSLLRLIKKIEMQYDFYLDYNMKEKDYSKEWKLYFPKNF